MKSRNILYGVLLRIAAPTVAVLAVACGSATVHPTSQTPAASSATTPSNTRPIADADVVDFTLTAREFGSTFAGYDPAQSTSPLTLEDLDGEPCAADLLAALKQFGFERGYNRDWVRPDSAPGDWDLSVGSYVEVYPDAAAAHKKLEFDRSYAVKPLPAGCDVQLESSSVFDVSAVVGEEAFGYRQTTLDDAGRPNTYTWVEFRRGQVIASTDVIREDSRDTASETANYAQVLDAHLVHSLSAPE